MTCNSKLQTARPRRRTYLCHLWQAQFRGLVDNVAPASATDAAAAGVIAAFRVCHALQVEGVQELPVEARPLISLQQTDSESSKMCVEPCGQTKPFKASVA